MSVLLKVARADIDGMKKTFNELGRKSMKSGLTDNEFKRQKLLNNVMNDRIRAAKKKKGKTILGKAKKLLSRKGKK